MTLEVSVAEIVVVKDIFGALKQFFAKLIRSFSDDDSETEDQTADESDGNKAPPASQEQQPQDLSVDVEDTSKTEESFGP